MMLRHTLRVALGIALVAYFIAFLLVLGLRYVVLPQAESFRPRIEAAVSERIHAQLSIGKLTPHWMSFQPGLEITNLTIRDPRRPHRADHSARHRDGFLALAVAVHPDPVELDRRSAGPARGAQQRRRAIGCGACRCRPGTRATIRSTTWLLRQQAIVLRGGTLRWRDARHNEPELALQDIRLAILNDGYDHRLALQAPADGKVLFGPLDFRAHFTHARTSAMGKPINWSGQGYISTGPVDLPMLSRYIDFPIETFAGRIDNAIWVEFGQGRIKSASGELSGTDIALRVRPTQPKLDLPVARFAWTAAHEASEYTLQLRDLHAELGQPPLPDGTPVTRALALHDIRRPLPDAERPARAVDQLLGRSRRSRDTRRIQPRATAAAPFAEQPCAVQSARHRRQLYDRSRARQAGLRRSGERAS